MRRPDHGAIVTTTPIETNSNTPTETSPATYDGERLSASAREHLWMHFTRMSA